MKKALVLMMVVLSMALSAAAQNLEVVGVINEPIKPYYLAVDDQQIYIAESAAVHIYSVKDFKKVGSFGKAGAGPEEFMSPPGGGGGSIALIPGNDQLVVSAMGKINTYTKDGKFKKTLKIQSEGTTGMATNYLPVGEGYIGWTMARTEGGTAAFATNLMDGNFKVVKELNRIVVSFGEGKFNLFDMIKRMMYTSDGEWVYYLSDDEKELIVTGKKGELIRKIPLNLGKVPLTQVDIQRFYDSMGKRVQGAQLEQLKKMFVFPENYPVAMNLVASGNMLFLTTWKRQGDTRQVVVFDVDAGKMLKEQYVPIHTMEGITPFPFTYHKGVFYAINEIADDDDPDELVLKVVRQRLVPWSEPREDGKYRPVKK